MRELKSRWPRLALGTSPPRRERRRPRARQQGAANLFGDFLSDLGPAFAGIIGVSPSVNLNPEREFPSVLEPVLGSAADGAGKGIADLLGQIWPVAMVLEHLGHFDAAAAVVKAMEAVLTDGPETGDLGGEANTIDVGRAVVEVQ